MSDVTELKSILNELWSCGVGAGHDLVTRFEGNRMQEEHVDDAFNRITALAATPVAIDNAAVLNADEESDDWKRGWDAGIAAYKEITAMTITDQPSAQPSDTPYPNCGACPGNGTICKTSCNHSDESPQVAQPSAEHSPVKDSLTINLQTSAEAINGTGDYLALLARKAGLHSIPDAIEQAIYSITNNFKFEGLTDQLERVRAAMVATPPTVDQSQDDGAVKS